MVVTFAVVKYKCKHSDTESIHWKKGDPIDVNESVLYSDVPTVQSQQESSPVYETIIMMKSEGTARVPATDAYSVDLKENIASKKITTQTNEAYGIFTSINMENISCWLVFFNSWALAIMITLQIDYTMSC